MGVDRAAMRGDRSAQESACCDCPSLRATLPDAPLNDILQRLRFGHLAIFPEPVAITTRLWGVGPHCWQHALTPGVLAACRDLGWSVSANRMHQLGPRQQAHAGQIVRRCICRDGGGRALEQVVLVKGCAICPSLRGSTPAG